MKCDRDRGQRYRVPLLGPDRGGDRGAFYFATPHHSWERGTNENTNGLLRQYLPKRTSMARVTQIGAERIATKLNTSPRKRLGYRTPEECYVRAG